MRALYLEHGFKILAEHGYSINPTLIRPQSRGHLALRSPDPFDSPIIQPNYCSATSDLETLVYGVKLARRIGQTTAFDAYRKQEVWPGHQIQDDDTIRSFIRQHGQTLYHPVGTCKMGHDSKAVVDDRLRVPGVDRLCVVDASIMPTIVGGDTNAPTLMIAEKAADLIREDWKSNEPKSNAKH